MSPVQFASPLGPAQANPVRGTVGGAGEAALLDDGFKEDGAVAVPGLPGCGEPSRGEAQQLGGEAPRVDPRKDVDGGTIANFRCTTER